ncbi:MAG: hypothetical protein AB1306_11205 [Nitrospirota bacterium]
MARQAHHDSHPERVEGGIPDKDNLIAKLLIQAGITYIKKGVPDFGTPFYKN